MNDDDLRDMFHDAVADVRPADGLEAIRERTAHRHRTWLPPTLAAVAATVLVLAGAAALTHQSGGRNGANPSTPSTKVSTTPTLPSSAVIPRAVPIYYVGDTANGPRLFREFHREQVCGDPACRLKASVVSAVTTSPDDTDYRLPWPAGTSLSAIEYAGGTITIGLGSSLRDRPAGMSDAEARAAVQQLIYSAQAGLGQGRVPVRITLDGSPADQVLGVPVAEPLARDTMEAILAPVWIASPAEGQRVGGTFHVTGVAASFEANVIWQLRQGTRVVKSGNTTAQQCCQREPYSFTVRNAPAGTYTLLVRDDGGSHVSPDTKTVVVH